MIIKNANIIGIRRIEDANPNKQRSNVYITFPSNNIDGLGCMSFTVFDWQARQVAPDLAIMDNVDIVYHNEENNGRRYPVLDYLISKR